MAKNGELVVNCFQNLYLWLSETAAVVKSTLEASCELLSKFVSLTFRNSQWVRQYQQTFVVNCFQNLYLWLSETAKLVRVAYSSSLWIAFKICIFDFQKQHIKTMEKQNLVVNCFQNLYLWLSETASRRKQCSGA